MMAPKSRLHGRSRSFTPRRTDFRPVRQRFLIVSEGEETEPNYFSQFRSPTVAVKVVGEGCDPYTLVSRVLQLIGEGVYDQVWVVFDRDESPAERFNAALALARNHKVKVAYSNQAFELWYLLHFQYMDSALPRAEYIQRLGEQLRHVYKKESKTIYIELLALQHDAIRNAARLLAEYNPVNPAQDDPSTTVHLLVIQLNKYAGPVMQTTR